MFKAYLRIWERFTYYKDTNLESWNLLLTEFKKLYKNFEQYERNNSFEVIHKQIIPLHKMDMIFIKENNFQIYSVIHGNGDDTKFFYEHIYKIEILPNRFIGRLAMGKTIFNAINEIIQRILHKADIKDILSTENGEVNQYLKDMRRENNNKKIRNYHG